MSMMGMTLGELVQMMRERSQRLPFEIGTYIALEVCESVIRAPAVVSMTLVRITDDGIVSVYAPPHSAGNAEAAQSVGGVLGGLLVAAGSGVPPVLLQLVEHGPSDGRWDLARLRDELEASLVPLNRAASRRVLARLVKDLQRPVHKSSRPPPPPAKRQSPDLDADLDALLDGSLADSVDEELPTTQLPALDASGNPLVDLDEVLSKRAPGSPGAMPPGAVVSPPPRRPSSIPPPRSEPPPRRPPSEPPRKLRSGPPPELLPDSEPALPSMPRDEGLPTAPRGGLAGLDDYDDLPQAKQGRWGLAVLGLIGVLAIAIAALAVLRPDVIDRIMGRAEEPDYEAEMEEARQEQERLRQQAEADLLAAHGDLTIRTTSTRAQVLLFIGRGPAVAENLPMGVAHEFVAIADGRSPTRAVVPPDAQWSEASADQPSQYELAMQTGDREMTFENLDLGTSHLERGDMGQPTGSFGRVRVITTPQGARVFLLIGFGGAHVSDLPIEESQELLIFEEGFVAQRIFVGPSDWQGSGDAKVAEIEVELQSR